MRKLCTLFLVFLLVNAGHSFAQWNLTGNNNATSTSIVGTTNAVPLRLATKNTTRLFIDTSGRVAIGNTAPRQLFTVQSSGTVPAAGWITSGNPVFAGYGEGTAGNADFNLMMASSTAANARGVFGMKRSRGTLAAPAAVQSNDQLGSLLVSGYDGSNFQGAAAVDFLADGTPSAGNVPTRISFVTGSNGGNRTERLRIGNTGDIAMNGSQFFLQKSNGNIGIGTTTPAARLDVNGNLRLADGTQGAGKVLKSDANGVASWGKVGAADLLGGLPPADYSCSRVAGSLNNVGAYQVAISGNYAYCTGFYSNTLQVINITNPAAPGNTGSVSTGSNPYGVAVLGNYAYVANSTAGNVQCFNISNPAAPTVAGAVTTSVGTSLLGAAGNYVFAVSNNREFRTIDMVNPAIPTITGSTTIDSAASAMAISGDFAYIVTRTGKMQVVNIANPAAPLVVATINTGKNTSDVTLAGNYAYVVNQNDSTIQIFNIASPTAPVLVSTTKTKEMPTNIAVSGQFAVVAFYSSIVTAVYNVSNPAALALAGQFQTGWSANQVKAGGGQYFFMTFPTDNTFRTISLQSCKQALGVDSAGNITTAPVLWAKKGENIYNTNNNGFVGIGTDAPTNPLHIKGSMKYEDGNQGDGKVLMSDWYGDAYWGTFTEQDPKVKIANNGYVPRWSDSAAALIKGSIYDNVGQVIIGSSTTASTNILNVNGEAFVNGLRIGRGSGWQVSNTVFGYNNPLLDNTTGKQNTALGNSVLNSNTTGNNNTGVGFWALYSHTTGSNNTAVGNSALSGNATGSNNTALGSSANVSTYLLTNAMALGANATVNASNKVRIGNASVTIVESNAGSWTTSDGRFKTNVREEVKGLEFIKLLRPVVYNFDTKKYEQHLMQNLPASDREKIMSDMASNMAKATAIRQSGFIAQEVEDAARKSGYDFNGVHAPESATDNYSVSYEKMVVPLVKAVQELAAKVEKLEAQLTAANGSSAKTATAVAEQNISFGSISLSQNTPNPPVNNFTRIAYEIPTGAAKAELLITDLMGRVIKQVALNTFGKGMLNVDTQALNAGTYNYSLLVDGKLIDTRKMVVAR